MQRLFTTANRGQFDRISALRTLMCPRRRTSLRTYASSSASQEPLRLVATTPQATQLVAHYMASSLNAGDCYLLYGEVGAGKSHFSRAFIRAASKDEFLPVPSPTFLLQNTYNTPSPSATIHHLDLYRLSGDNPSDLSRLELENSLPSSISLIEWSERLPDNLKPGERLEMKIEVLKDSQRAALLDDGSMELLDNWDNISASSAEDDKEEQLRMYEQREQAGDDEESNEDPRWRRIELTPHGDRWTSRLSILQRLVGPKGSEYGLFLETSSENEYHRNEPRHERAPPKDEQRAGNQDWLPGDWDCPRCSTHNFARRRECFKCNEPRPENANEREGRMHNPRGSSYMRERRERGGSFSRRGDDSFGDGSKRESSRGNEQYRPGDWYCDACGALVFASKRSCYRCGAPKPDGYAG